MKLLYALLAVLFLCASASAQGPTAYRVRSGNSAPTIVCVPGPPVTELYIRSDTDQLYICSAAPNVWALVSGGGGGLADPGSNAIIKRTALNTTAAAVAGTDYVAPAGSGASLTGILFSQLGGAATDVQVADTITLTNITQITNRAIGNTTGDLAVNRIDDGGVAATQALFSGAGGAAGFRAIADADVPDAITVNGTDNVTWTSVNKSGSSLGDLATRSASDLNSGTAAAARGGTGLGAPADDQLIVGNGTGFDFKTLPSCSNGTTDKLLYNSTTNTITCGADQTTGGGSGITSLNTLTGTTQTFSKTDDTNVTLTITSTGTDHNFALGWTGTLADARVANNITLDNITQITARAIGDTSGDLAASRVDDGGAAATQALFSGAGSVAAFRAIADADIPNTITIDLATVATTANAGDSATAFFSSGTVEAARLPALSGLTGSVTDGQVPNDITIDLATLATTATTANAGDSATAFFSAGTVEAARLPDLSGLNGAVTDAQVPNTVTIDLASVATTANAGDSATAFFSTGTVETARLGSGTAGAGNFLRGDQTWQPVTASPAGSDTQVQFNDGGALGADAGMVYNKTTDLLTVGGLLVNGAGTSDIGIGDTDNSHFLNLLVGSNLTADRNLTFTTGDAARTITINGDITLPAGTAAVIGSSNSWGDGVKQTFNPDATNAGINIGAQAGDPSTLANGDVWYNSSTNKYRCRENGVTVDCIGAGGGGSGTINAGVTNAIPKYVASTTIDDSLASDDGTTFAYSGTGGVSSSAAVTGVLSLFDTNQSHYLQITPGSNITADRAFTIRTGDANRALEINGDLTTAAAFSTVGANALVLTTTASTNITLPTTGTVSTLAGTETLTTKTIALGSNTVSGTTAQFNTANTDGDFATLAGAETLTNKTLTAPVISTITNTGTVTLPTATDTLVGRATTDTLTNKRITHRVTSITSNATWSPNADTDDLYKVTAQAVAVTTISNPSGTPTEGQRLMIRVKDDGTARALTWSGTQWRASSDLALPTTTIISKTLYVGFIWNATDSKWDLLAVLNNF